MSKVNVWFGIKKPTVLILRGNMKKNPDGITYERNELTSEERERFKTYHAGRWKSEVSGGAEYDCVSSYLSKTTVAPRDPTNLELADVTDALAKFAGNIFVIGAWNMDGSQYGTELTQVENGVDSIENQDRVVTMVQEGVRVDLDATILAGETVEVPNMVEQVTYVGNGTFEDVPHYDTVVVGTPFYPINLARAKKYIPDDVTYDADGVELTRTVATAPKDVHRVAGWKDRRWS